ncbi:hypothetical protein EXN66_Car008710 [Channa argus]|uniref:Uncharacterized protein n=1 Tax=Channa argus TaxID=215402 RepID=A0A6G1PSB9_CHAAH|nr:hypothetical protein EXN66_Car008710 [Channa argus]
MAGQAKQFPRSKQPLGTESRGPVFGSPALERFASTAAAAAASSAELFHFEALYPRIALYLRGQDITRGPTLFRRPKFRLKEQLLDPIKGRHALLLDLQRLDPRRRFPLRISRQGAAA